jgi:hypothetical protein
MRPDEEEGLMLSTSSRVQVAAATIVLAAVVSAAGLASPEGGLQPLAGVTVDQATVVRHRALGLLGQPRVIVDRHLIARHRALGRLGQEELDRSPDSAVIARHRALGRLPAVSANRASQTETASPNWSPWKKSVLGLAVLAACLLVGFGITRASRASTREAA